MPRTPRLTCIGLNPGRNFTCADFIEIGNVLPQDGTKVAFSKSLGTDLSRIDPDIHISERANKHSHSYNNDQLTVNLGKESHRPMQTK